MANALATAASPYLRSAAHQPVAWRQWEEASFASAREANKPILLDIGAVWCHWCHVMDRESYEDPAIAEIINHHFIAIKVDRDERPDVDSRYQAAVGALTGQGGWPLTAFLTPEGDPFFGGTYFPPEALQGRPSFRRVLESIAEAYAGQGDEVRASARRVMETLPRLEAGDGEPPRSFSPAATEAMIAAAVKTFDDRNGGFGGAPKFPHPAMIDLLLDRFRRSNDAALGNIAFLTLDKMARGGVYDHLGGGFHRYSVDEHWGIPHFEKMSYDNSELLKNYVHGAQVAASPFYRSVALDIIRWVDACLSDREQGGFFSSQDADASLDDDGGYFTWSRAQAAAVLEERELALAAAFYGIGEHGGMAQDPEQNVLAVTVSLAEIARRLGLSQGQAREMLECARAKLQTARQERPTPFVDRTIYASWNAMFVSAYLEARRGLWALATEEERARLAAAGRFALKTLDRMLGEIEPGRGLRHTLFAAGDGGGSRRLPFAVATLDDQVFPALAALDAFEFTGEARYLRAAQELADLCLARYADAAGGFFDLPAADATGSIGALAIRRKPLQDSPTPSGNAAALQLLERMSRLTEDPRYRQAAARGLECFAGTASAYGIFAASYGIAAALHEAEPFDVVIRDGGDGQAEALATVASQDYRLGKTVIRFPSAADSADLPPSLCETAINLPAGDGRSLALVCRARVCAPPAYDPATLRALLASA